MYLYICGHISRAQPAQAHADHSDPVTLFSFCLNVITGALAVSVRLTGPIECCCRSASFLVWCFLVSVWRREPFVYGINIRWIMRATQWIWNSCCYIRRKREKRILWITPFDYWVELSWWDCDEWPAFCHHLSTHFCFCKLIIYIICCTNYLASCEFKNQT